MGAPAPEMNPIEDASAEALLGSLRTIAAAERRKHASVFNYWLSIRRDRQFPPIRDLDPLEISDAGPFSILLEMIGGGEDAEIRHLGQALKNGTDVDKIGEAPNPSLLSCIASRLPIVAACREAFAFEDSFETADGKTRCWVTLLPFSATGTWIDYVYGFVSLDPAPGAVEDAPEVAEVAPEPLEEVTEPEEDVAEPVQVAPEPFEETAEPVEIEAPAVEVATATPTESAGKAGFSRKFFESLANVGGFYGRPAEVELDMETVAFESGDTSEPEVEPGPVEAAEANEPDIEPAAIDEPEIEAAELDEPEVDAMPVEAAELDEPEVDAMPVEAAELDEPEVDAVPVEAAETSEPEEPQQIISTSEGTLQSKLTEVRAKADEARQAKLRANVALYEGLSAAYDFALDAEDSPEEYLRLVEAQGLKIQLRSPMKPVVKLAFDGMCDDATVKQLEAILAWAFDEELPRGSLAERIEAAGGIGPILTGQARAA